MTFETTLRSNIMKTAKDMSKGGTRFSNYRNSKCNEKYWHLTNQGGFLLRKGVTPADGVRDIFTNGKKYAFECAVAIVIIMYKAVLDTLGKEQFNILFPNLLLFSWHYDSDLGLTQRSVSSAYASPGDVLYFKNPDVNPDKMEWQGENVIKMGNDLYYGHGLGIKTSDEMIKSLNRHRRANPNESAYLEDQISFPNYRYLSQFAPTEIRRF
jgi:protein-glutamine gamma-glutamyltransferase